MPLFAQSCAEKFSRYGASLDDVEADFEEGEDVTELETKTFRYRAGRLFLYEYRSVRVFGRVDNLVTEMWIYE